MKSCKRCGSLSGPENILVARQHSVCYFMTSLVSDHAVMCRHCGNTGPITDSSEKAVAAWNATN